MQRFPSSSIALNYMFHFVFYCVPPRNFKCISQKYINPHIIVMARTHEDSTRKWNSPFLFIASVNSIQFNSIHFNPIQFISIPWIRIQFNWINPSFSWHYYYYYDFAGTSGGAFSAVAAAAVTSIVIVLFDSHDGVVLFLLHSYWHSWGEWWCKAMLVLEKGRAAVRWDLRGGGFEYCTCYLCVPPGTYYEEEKEDIVQCVM